MMATLPIYGVAVYGDAPYTSEPLPLITDLAEVIIIDGVYDELILVAGSLTDAELLAYAKKNSPSPEWDSSTIMNASFDSTLEGGSIDLNGIEIVSWKVRKMQSGDSTSSLIGVYPITENLVMSCEDVTVASNKDTTYEVLPVGVNGIEGASTSVTYNLPIEGWWILDPDDTDNCVQFLYNLDDTSIQTDEDRVEMSTFAKYPIVRYGKKRAKRGTLSSLFIPDESSISPELLYEKLDYLTSLHKPLLLKGYTGKNYLVDISAPQEDLILRPNGFKRVTVNWVEVGEVT